jgi:outer membrane protein assembly factor BamB
MRRVAVVLVSLLLSAVAARADDWPQWLGPQRDGVWRETGILEKFPAGGPRVRWKVEIGAGYAGPSVAGGKVYVADRIIARNAARPKSAFARGRIAGIERILCLNEADGKVLWKHEYDCPYTVSYPAGPRASPLVHGGKVYTYGAEGHLICFEADSGKIVWQKHLGNEDGSTTPLWGFSSSPLIDGDKLIVIGTGEAIVQCFHKDTGAPMWKALNGREPGYAPPMIYEAGGKRQLIIWHPQALVSLNPETGEPYWSQGFAVKSGLSIPTPRKLDDRLFITSFYNGAMMMKLDKDKPAATVEWRSAANVTEKKTDRLSAIMTTPFLSDGHIYGVCSYGQLRCLTLTGERLWETDKATGGNERWGHAFLTPNADRWFIFNEKGDLIIARLTPKGYAEIDRTKIIAADNRDPGRAVVWTHPAYANKCIYVRNDRELICASLAKE